MLPHRRGKGRKGEGRAAGWDHRKTCASGSEGCSLGGQRVKGGTLLPRWKTGKSLILWPTVKLTTVLELSLQTSGGHYCRDQHGSMEKKKIENPSNLRKLRYNGNSWNH